MQQIFERFRFKRNDFQMQFANYRLNNVKFKKYMTNKIID